MGLFPIPADVEAAPTGSAVWVVSGVCPAGILPLAGVTADMYLMRAESPEPIGWKINARSRIRTKILYLILFGYDRIADDPAS